MYNDWDLVLAAYNCGSGNINKAIRRSGGKTSYWEIRNFLPVETRGYLPAFIAVNYIMNYASEHNIYPIEPDISCFKVDTIGVSDHLSFAQISEYLDIPIEYIEFLNPAYKENFIPNVGKANTLCLPVDKVGDFLMNEKTIYALKTEQDIKDSIAVANNEMIASSSSKRGNAIVYKVRSGDVLGKIAQKYHCRVSQIKDWNNLYSDRLNIGQKLYIYAKPSYAVQNKKKANVDAEKSSHSGKYLYHIVKSGDNLWDIANKYDNVTIEQIKELNKAIDVKRLKLGTKLRIKPIG